jgi:hypothetical protein
MEKNDGISSILPERKGEKRSSMRRVHKVRTKTRRALYLFLFFLAKPTELTFFIGIPLVALGQLINLITYGTLRKRDTLVTWGPYAWCRNPFYFGTLLSDFGFCAMCNPADFPVAVVTAGYAIAQGTFFYLQILKEEKLLLTVHGSGYEEYCQKVRWRLLPSIVSAIRNSGFRFQWSAKLALYNRIFSRVVSAAFWVCAFWGVKEMTGSRQTGIINMNFSWRALLHNPYIILTACATAIFYYLLRFAEGRERERARAKELESAPAAVHAAGHSLQKSEG